MSTPTTPRHILLATDLSSRSDRALDRAVRLAREWDARLVALTVVDPERDRELVVGPYQGTLGCLRIAYGRGVCGTAAATGQTQLVPDVHAFPGHIACDGRSASEVVVPVFDPTGNLIAVFDVDATEPAAFDAVDAAWLEKILAAAFS